MLAEAACPVNKIGRRSGSMRFSPSYLLVAVLVGVICTLYCVCYFTNISTCSAAYAEELPSAQELLAINKQDKVLGCDKARSTIIEYSSLACPHCADFHKKNFPLIKKNLVDTCKAKYVYRELPTSKIALNAAMLASCGAEISGKAATYYTLIHHLFNSRESWTSPIAEKLEGILLNIAKLNGITKSQFEACMENQDLAAFIHNRAFQTTQVLAIQYTPTILVNGKKIDKATFDNIANHISPNTADKKTKK
ncbi:conserved hypothetical protein [Alphaproteobacteria bacterium]